MPLNMSPHVYLGKPSGTSSEMLPGKSQKGYFWIPGILPKNSQEVYPRILWRLLPIIKKYAPGRIFERIF